MNEQQQRLVELSNGLFDNMQSLHSELLASSVSSVKDHIKMLFGGLLASATAITLNQWVAATTLVYSVLQIGLLLPIYYQKYKNWREKRKAKNAA